MTDIQPIQLPPRGGLAELWEATGRPAPNWQGKAQGARSEPASRAGTCALTGVRGQVWPLAKVTTTLTTLDRLPFRDVDPAGIALGPAGAWALRHRTAMQMPHIQTGAGLDQATPSALYAALAGLPHHPDWWVLVPQSRQKHLLPWAAAGLVRVDDESLPWTPADVDRLGVYAGLRREGFGEAALAAPAPLWPVLTKCPDPGQILTLWPLLDPWREHPAYLDVAARATRKEKDTP